MSIPSAQRIEVLRGPGRLLWPDALHGVINAISPPSVTDHQLLTIEAGANDYYRMHFSQSGNTEQHGYRLTNSAHDGGYKDDSGLINKR